MFDVWQANYALELWGVAFSAVGIACTLLLVRTDKSYRNLLVAMFSLELLAAAGDATTIVYAGEVSDFARAMSHLGNFATFAGTFLLQAALSMYLCLRFGEAGGPTYRAWRVCVCLLAIVMCALAAFGVFYGFDEDNVYYRKDGYWLSLAFVGGASLVNAALVIVNRSRIGVATLVCLLVYTVAPIIASVVQAFIFGPNLAIVVGVMALVIVFMELQAHSARMLQQRTEELALAKEQAANDRIAVMVSQIQPHFLFNTLDTIYGLTQEDADAAADAIASFSRYLRTNLASLNQTVPVPVEREMDHVRTYLELERTSDPERVAYSFDVQATGFSVPALSVQTLAENAVRHGIGATAEGGMVKVSTRELPHEFTVTVADDGAGFEVGRASEGEGTHVGIENTRARLAAMCNGSLDVCSKPGAGTCAVIHIPKSSSAENENEQATEEGQ